MKDYLKKVMKEGPYLAKVAGNLINKLRELLNEDYIFTQHSTIVMEKLKEGGPAQAVDYLKSSFKYFSFSSIRFLIRLYQYALAIEKKEQRFWQSDNEGEKVIIHFCCWGASYSDKVKNYLLPSLLAENNLPALAQNYKIALVIHCDSLTKKKILQTPAYRRLLSYATIVFYVFPFRLMALYNSKSKKISSVYPQIRYFLLGVCQAHAFKIGMKYRAYLSYLMPDVVLSESFYKYAFSKIKDKKMVLTTTCRSDFNNVQPYLDNYYKSGPNKNLIAITGEKLLELQILHMHPYEYKRFVCTKTDNFSPSARLIFKHKNGYIIRCFHYHPAIINCGYDDNKDIRLDYLPIDTTVVNEIIAKNIPFQQQIWICTQPAAMAIMELSDKTPEREIIVNEKKLMYEELVVQVSSLLTNAPTIFNTPLNQFFTTFRHEFIVPGLNNPMVKDEDIIDDVKFFESMQQLNCNMNPSV